MFNAMLGIELEIERKKERRHIKNNFIFICDNKTHSPTTITSHTFLPTPGPPPPDNYFFVVVVSDSHNMFHAIFLSEIRGSHTVIIFVVVVSVVI